MEKLLEILVGQLPEAIYFALFMLFTKEIKEKRFLFIVVTILEYLLLFQIFNYSIWSHILFFIITYVVLKVLYKDKAQITDIFTLGIASMVITLFNIVTYFIIWKLFDYYPIYVVCTRLFMVIVLVVFKHKLPRIQKLYKKYWNRNDKLSKKMKSTTFRALNAVLFNTMFVVINVCLIYALFLIRG